MVDGQLCHQWCKRVFVRIIHDLHMWKNIYNYIKNCKPRTCIVVPKKNMLDLFLFKVFFSLFTKLVLNGISPFTNIRWVWFTCNSRTNRVGTILWLEHETLHSHTSHTWELLDANCFKPFKVAFKKERNNNVVKGNHNELDKTTLGRWVDKTLYQLLFKQNVKSGFGVTWIGH
jgi:hypothetical protein